MFSLIITIIAIALVAALAVASIYYGGSAFEKGTAGAEAATIINESQQVSAARSMASADGNANTTVADLVTGNYLSSAPADLELNGNAVEDTLAAPGLSAEVCDQINQRSGNTVTTYTSPATVASVIDARFGCATDSNALTPLGSHFAFK